MTSAEECFALLEECKRLNIPILVQSGDVFLTKGMEDLQRAVVVARAKKGIDAATKRFIDSSLAAT